MTGGPAAPAAAQRSLGDSLGGAFGLSWLDTATGGLVAGTTDAARSAQVRAAGATPKVVRHSASELYDVRSTLDRRADGVPASVAGWYVDAPANEVVVSGGTFFQPVQEVLDRYGLTLETS